MCHSSGERESILPVLVRRLTGPELGGVESQGDVLRVAEECKQKNEMRV